MVTIKELTLTCKYILSKKLITSGELIFLLDGRRKGLIKFLLVDIREPREHESLSIEGTDMLFPVSKIHLYPEVLEELRHINFVFYCTNGGRSTHLLEVSKKMGFPQGCQLNNGILSYQGKTKKDLMPANIF